MCNPITAARAGLAALLIAGAGAPALAQYPADDNIRRHVAQRLFDKDIRGIDVSVYRGIVTLRGTVPTLWIKEKAIDEAQKADDMTVVVSELTVPRGESDDRLAEEVADRLRRYVFFTIFDDADIEVDDGVVTLTGRVTMPYKAEALADLAAHVPGVQAIRNEVRALPVSRYDDQLRYAIAREIYGDPLFSHYAIGVNPPVHVIVEHAAVTLTGAVSSEVERRKAEVIARGFLALSVTNKLRVERDD